MPVPDWVKITHPELGDSPNPVSRQSYEDTWSKRGWKLIKPAKKPTRKDTD